jgi:predicted N-acetyltransferase YhbS/uncharacterized damage-inducible protein DinB
MLHLRRGELRDLPLLLPIEDAGGPMFIAAGHPEMDDAPGISDDEAFAALTAGLVTVAELDGTVVGWVDTTRLGEELYVHQISVHPDAGRRGIGSALMRHVIDQARVAREPSIVLDTQADVAWNAPWYARFGFVPVTEHRWTDAMRAKTAMQIRMGLDWSTRVHMRLRLDTLGGDRDITMDRRGGERQMLLGFLDWYREGVILKIAGASPDVAARRPGPSETSMLGLVNHLALVEDSWFVERFEGGAMPAPFTDVDWESDPDYEFRTARDEPIAVVVARYRAALERSRFVTAAHSLDDAGADTSRHQFSLRWVLLHMIEETARHLGHLDLLRELGDGVTGE